MIVFAEHIIVTIFRICRLFLECCSFKTLTKSQTIV